MLFTACGADPDKNYIGKNQKDCAAIKFTCPQFQELFNDEKGCGCQPSEIPDDPELRSLNNLMQGYLSEKIIQPKCGGEVLTDFIFLDNEEVEPRRINQNLWVIVGEVCVEENRVKESVFFSAPVILDLEETGKNYIIRGHVSVAEGDDYEACVRDIFTVKAAEAILGETKTKDIKKTEEVIRGKATLIFGVPMQSDELSIQQSEME